MRSRSCPCGFSTYQRGNQVWNSDCQGGVIYAMWRITEPGGYEKDVLTHVTPSMLPLNFLNFSAMPGACLLLTMKTRSSTLFGLKGVCPFCQLASFVCWTQLASINLIRILCLHTEGQIKMTDIPQGFITPDVFIPFRIHFTWLPESMVSSCNLTLK